MFRPSCLTAPDIDQSLTGSAACVVLHNGDLLAIRHRFGGKLGLPGGGAHPGESAACTAQRETWEETGLEVRTVRRLVNLGPAAHIFECEPLEEPDVTAHVPPLHALPEVIGIHWIDPATIDAEDWRFPAQLPELQAAIAALTAGRATR